MAALVTTVPNATLPVDLATVRSYVRASSSDDALLTQLVQAAAEMAETYTNTTLMQLTRRLSLDCFPYGEISIPRPPLLAVSSIVYTDANGDSQTWSSSLYQVDTDSQPGRIIPAYTESYPDTRSGTLNAVQITYTCGYASASDIPPQIVTGILQFVYHWFDKVRCGDTAVDSMTLPAHVAALWDSEYSPPVLGGYGG